MQSVRVIILLIFVANCLGSVIRNSTTSLQSTDNFLFFTINLENIIEIIFLDENSKNSTESVIVNRSPRCVSCFFDEMFDNVKSIFVKDDKTVKSIAIENTTVSLDQSYTDKNDTISRSEVEDDMECEDDDNEEPYDDDYEDDDEDDDEEEEDICSNFEDDDDNDTYNYNYQ